ncbi:MAG TPA: glycosyl hydrolase-related protein [Candidatus Binatia bacterium]
MKVFLVSHTHWDREWYRTFQTFRARLVDTVDRVLELLEEDEGFRFLLDGQTIALEDYLEVRPERRAALEAACRAGRIAIGPWWVQPDSLLPAGEAHVRNLLEGRRVGDAFGPTSRVAYTPDSFGHPAQLPQLFAGFGLGPFVYWRGNGDELDDLPAEWTWQGPDGSTVLAHHLGEGYFAASGLPHDPDEAAAFLSDLVARLAARTRNDAVLLMNGFDHAPPEAHGGVAAAALAAASGHDVHRALLEDFAAELRADAPTFRGELLGARTANLLPGVWSTRIPQKLRNRRAETELLAWAEPWSALGSLLGGPDERAALRAAWRELLRNQAHDSICGCSQDRVHEQMEARYDAATELARETATRAMERIAGLGVERRTPPGAEIELAVFNPSPHPRTDVVRFALDPTRWFEFGGDGGHRLDLHPLLRANLERGFTVDGEPARVVADDDPGRVRLVPERAPLSVEFVVRDVPALGWKRVRLAPAPDAAEEQVDDGREIAQGDLAVRVADDGTLDVRFGATTFTGLCAVEDTGDRGDTYDFDPVAGEGARTVGVRVRRLRDASGLEHLVVERELSVPAALAPDRSARSDERVSMTLEVEARLALGVRRVDLRVRLVNTARDHRLRLLFPTGRPTEACDAATTFDVARRTTAPREAHGWVHPPPRTFPQQGFVHANGLTVVAPGLPEAEVTEGGVIALTLVRAVGWLARMDLRSRPQIAGPTVPTPGAQCLGAIEARLHLVAGLDPAAAHDAEVGLRAVGAGSAPLAPEGVALLEVEPGALVLSALKPAERERGVVLRLLNPTDAEHEARVRLGFPVSRALAVRLDETSCEQPVELRGRELCLRVPAHALRSVLLLP